MYQRETTIENVNFGSEINIYLINNKGKFQVFYCTPGTDIMEHLESVYELTKDRNRYECNWMRRALTYNQAVERFNLMVKLSKSMKFETVKVMEPA